MSDEWIVEVDESDKFLGRILREVAHDEKKLRWHREVMMLLYTDQTHRQFLLQHRSMLKRQLPGYWTLSVTGHVDFGDMALDDKEGYLAAGKREAREEIGVKAKNIQLVGKLPQKISQNWAMMGLVTGEYEGELKLDPDEESEVRIFDKSTITQISDKLTPGAKACLEYLNLI